MPALYNDFNLKRTVDLRQEGAGLIINYEVVDMEKIGNRECYKVEQKITTEAIYEQMNKDIAQIPEAQTLKSTIWVNKSERITAKSQSKVEDNVMEGVLIE